MNDTTVIGKAGKFHIAFRPAALTSHAGTVLLHEFVTQLGVAQVLDTEVTVKQRARGFRESEFILAACYSLILGGSCVADLQVLRGEPGTQALLEVAAIPSPQAMGEFLRRFGIGDIHDLLRALRLLQQRVHPQLVAWLPAPVATLDFDASIFAQCARAREGVAKAYTGERGYAPLLVYWAEVGEWLYVHMQRGNAYASKKAVWVLDKALALLPAGLSVQLRGDSAFYSRAFLAACEQRGLTYAISADKTRALCRQLQALPAAVWTPDPDDPRRAYAELRYAPSRQPLRRFCVKREQRVQADGTTTTAYHAVVTNDETRTPQQVVEWQLGRCAMENQIKELKHGFSLTQFPSQKFMANWAYLLCGQLAFNLVAWFKYLLVPPALLPATVKTLRHRLFNLAGKIITKGRHFFLVIREEYQFQEVWATVLNNLAALSFGAYP